MPMLCAVRLDLAVLVFRELQRLEHGVLVLRAGLARLVLGGGRAGQHQVAGAEGLELDRVGAGGLGGIAQAQGQAHVAVVVDAGLGDDEHVR